MGTTRELNQQGWGEADPARREWFGGYDGSMSFITPAMQVRLGAAEIVIDYHTDEDGQDTFLGAFLTVADTETRLLDSAHDDEDVEGFVDRAQVFADQMGVRLVVAEDVMDEV